MTVRRRRRRRRAGRAQRRPRPGRRRRARDRARGPRPGRRPGRAGRSFPTGACVQLGGEVVGNAPHRLPRAGRGARAHPGAVVRRGAGRDHPPGARVGRRRRLAVVVHRRRHALLREGRGRRWPKVVAGIDPDDPCSRTPTCTGSTGSASATGCARSARPRPCCALKELAAPRPRRRVDRAHQPVRLRPQDRGRRRHRLLRLRGVGEPARRRGVGHGRADGWPTGCPTYGSSTPVAAIAVDRDRCARDCRRRARSSAPTPWCSPSPPARRATSRSPASARRGSPRCAASGTRGRPSSWRRTTEPFWRDHRAERAVGERGRDRLDLAAAGGRAVRAGAARALRRVRGDRPGDAHPRGAGADRGAVRRPRRPARSPTWTRLWGTDPWTQGYVTNWRPGDVEAVGPLHGTHEPPFYVCGSDQWVAGYMEGAVRTGRAAARSSTARAGGVLMDFGLTDEQRSIVADDAGVRRARALPARGGGRAHRRAAARARASEIAQKAITAGLYAANMPEEVGGAGLDTVTWVLFEKELGRANYALHSCRRPALEHPAGRHRGAEGEATSTPASAASGATAWR